jgi:transcriptional regulator with XRE-family HTH domain
MEQSFGTALRKRRLEAGLTQRDLAERTELDCTYISKIENDRLPPPAADTVVLLSRILDIPPEDLLALAGKIPSEIQQMVRSSSAAQVFLREAQQRGMAEAEWRQLTNLLRGLKPAPDQS